MFEIDTNESSQITEAKNTYMEYRGGEAWGDSSLTRGDSDCLVYAPEMM